MTVTGRPSDQQPALIDVEAFFADPEFASASISPDGYWTDDPRWLLYLQDTGRVRQHRHTVA
jgi:hypothetical protein